MRLTHLYPPFLADTDGIEALAAPSSPLLQYWDSVEVYKLLRRRGRSLYPALPTLLDGNALLPWLLRRLGQIEILSIQVFIIVGRMRSL